jgi:hypothetical protein
MQTHTILKKDPMTLSIKQAGRLHQYKEDGRLNYATGAVLVDREELTNVKQSIMAYGKGPYVPHWFRSRRASGSRTGATSRKERELNVILTISRHTRELIRPKGGSREKRRSKSQSALESGRGKDPGIDEPQKGKGSSMKSDQL